jgi:hypothetical protein
MCISRAGAAASERPRGRKEGFASAPTIACVRTAGNGQAAREPHAADGPVWTALGWRAGAGGQRHEATAASKPESCAPAAACACIAVRANTKCLVPCALELELGGLSREAQKAVPGTCADTRPPRDERRQEQPQQALGRTPARCCSAPQLTIWPSSASAPTVSLPSQQQRRGLLAVGPGTK